MAMPMEVHAIKLMPLELRGDRDQQSCRTNTAASDELPHIKHTVTKGSMRC